MTPIIEDLSLSFIQSLSEQGEHHYVDDKLYLALNGMEIGQNNVLPGKPYRAPEGRLMCITQGWTRILINLREYVLKANHILYIAPNSVFEIIERDAQLGFMLVTLKTLPQHALPNTDVHIAVDNPTMLLVTNYFRLMWQETTFTPIRHEAINLLQCALMLLIKQMNACDAASISVSRQDHIFSRFLVLVRQNGCSQRNIDYYADKLCVTPNHLGAVIKKASGLTVMQWINRHIIQQAKLALIYTDKPIWEVSEDLNFANPSFFTKFFKKETGMTPRYFRQQT